MPARFFTEELPANLKFKWPNKNQLNVWLKQVLAEHSSRKLGELNYIACTDEYLLQVNREYLQHDDYTDIITFDNSDRGEYPIEGDIYISIERVRDNANKYQSPDNQELKRVVAHGLLHLAGFKDKTEEEAKAMRAAEEEALQLWDRLHEKEGKRSDAVR
jgi:probable rRNA maturation factor